MRMHESFILTLLFAAVSVIGDEDSRTSSTLTIYQGLGENPTWIKCGQISVQNSNFANVLATQLPIDGRRIFSKDSPYKRNTYQLKAVYKTSQGENELISSTNLCMILSNPTLMVVVSLDSNFSVVAINLVPRNDCRETSAKQEVIPVKLNFYFKYPENGPIPDTASYIQKLEREREAKERVGTTDNRSFIAKYWMYITPIVVLLIISGSSNPEGNQASR